MKIKAVVPWYGSKRLLAPEVVRQLGKHNSYWEILCGSLAVLLAKPPTPHEHANDLHGDLVNLARVLKDEDLAVALYARLARTLTCEALFDDCRRWWLEQALAPEAPDIDRAYRYFVVSWMGRNGVSGTRRFNHSYSVCWKKKGGSRASRFRAAVESIPWWHERLRNVVILRRDVFALLENVEDLPGVAIYADPPYLVDTRSKSGGGGVYEHDFTEADHERLASLLGRFQQARVVISHYESSALDRLYPGWLRATLPAVGKRMSAQARCGRQEAPEVLLVNGSVAEPARSLPLFLEE